MQAHAHTGRVAAASERRVRVRIEGTVRGVGFRPFVFHLVRGLGLGGFVRNEGRGVVLEVEGRAPEVTSFLVRLPSEAPLLARVDRLQLEELTLQGETGFTVLSPES